MTFQIPPLHQEAIDVITEGDVRADGVPVLFTSCQRDKAEAFVADTAGYSLIHHTRAGADLENLNLFDHMSMPVAYLHWFYLSSRFIVENEFPSTVQFFADFDNKTSTAFGIELPLLANLKPEVDAIENPVSGQIIPRGQWQDFRLLRTYVLDLLTHYSGGGSHGVNDSPRDDTLVRKFYPSASAPDSNVVDILPPHDMGLMMMLMGYLSANGGCTLEQRHENGRQTLGISLQAVK